MLGGREWPKGDECSRHASIRLLSILSVLSVLSKFLCFSDIPRRLKIVKSDANYLAPEMVSWEQLLIYLPGSSRP